MQKLKTIATISLLIFWAAGCSKPATGPSMQLQDAAREGDVSLGLSDDNGRMVFTYQMGPFDLPAKTASGGIPISNSGFNFGVEEAIWMSSFEPKVQGAEGDDLPPELIHQLILINHAEENTFCTAKQTGNPFAATTSSIKKVELPEGHGYLLMPADPLEASVTLRNPTGEDLHGVYIKIILTGKAVDDTKMISDVKPMLIDIDPCEHKPVSIAPGQFVEKTKDVFAPETGSVVKAYGLLQNYGVAVSLTANDEEDPFWQGVAEIDENYQVTSLEPFEDPAGVPLKRGEKLSITVAYDNVSDEWYEEATGGAMVYLAREDEEGDEAPVEEEESGEESSEDLNETEEPTDAVSVQSKLLSL